MITFKRANRRYEEGCGWEQNIISLSGLDEFEVGRVERRIVGQGKIMHQENYPIDLTMYDVRYWFRKLWFRKPYTISFDRGFRLVRVAHPNKRVVDRLSRQVQKARAEEAADNIGEF